MTTTTLPGNITISRPHDASGARIAIRVEDSLSGIQFLEVNMSPEQFALAVTGLGMQPCELTIRALHNVGKVRQVKTEKVRLPDRPYAEGERERAAQEACRPFEVDGWKARWRDALNHHNRTDDPGYVYRVTFVRFVDDEGV